MNIFNLADENWFYQIIYIAIHFFQYSVVNIIYRWQHGCVLCSFKKKKKLLAGNEDGDVVCDYKFHSHNRYTYSRIILVLLTPTNIFNKSILINNDIYFKLNNSYIQLTKQLNIYAISFYLLFFSELSFKRKILELFLFLLL